MTPSPDRPWQVRRVPVPKEALASAQVTVAAPRKPSPAPQPEVPALEPVPEEPVGPATQESAEPSLIPERPGERLGEKPLPFEPEEPEEPAGEPVAATPARPLPPLPKGKKGQQAAAPVRSAPPPPLPPRRPKGAREEVAPAPERRPAARPARPEFERERVPVRTGARPGTVRPGTVRRPVAREMPPRRGVPPFLIGALIGIGLAGILAGLFFLFLWKPGQSPTAVNPQPSIQTGEATQNTDTQSGAIDVAPTATTAQLPTVDPKATPAGLFDRAATGINKGQFDQPRGITIDSSGNFYVVDTGNLRIQKFDKDGKWVTMFGSKGDKDAQFSPMSEDAPGSGPSGIAADSAGDVYVTDTWNHRVQKFDKDGKMLGRWGSFISLMDAAAPSDPDKDRKFWGPRGIAVGPDGNVYVTDTGNKRVLIYQPDGRFVSKIDSGMTKEKIDANYAFSQPGELNEPIGIAVDKDSNIYVADTRNNRIQKFDKTGKPVAQWPVPKGSWDPGPFLEPFLAFDAQGNLYATAPTTHSVIKFGPDGTVLGQKDKVGNTGLQSPTGIAVASDGTVYVVDTAANAVVNMGKIP